MERSKLMLSTNNKISLRQLQILIILDIFGMGITTLPRTVSEISAQDGWLCIFFGTLLSCFFTFLITRLCAKFKNQGFVEFSRRLATYPVGSLLSIGLVTKIAVMLALQLRLFSEIIKQIMLFETPVYVISLCMLIIGCYAASKGYEARGRIAEILIFVIFIPLAFVFLIAITDVDFTNLKPILKSGKENIFKGSLYTAFNFSAIEFILLAYPYLKTDSKRVGQKIILSVFKGGVILSIITAITIARFGVFDIKRQMWQVLEIMDTIDLSDSFIERQDALIMSFWIISSFIIINAGIFFSSLILKNVVERGTHTFFIVITAILVFVISFIPQNLSELYYITDKMSLYFGFVYTFIIPTFLLFASRIKKVGAIDED